MCTIRMHLLPCKAAVRLLHAFLAISVHVVRFCQISSAPAECCLLLPNAICFCWMSPASLSCLPSNVPTYDLLLLNVVCYYALAYLGSLLFKTVQTVCPSTSLFWVEYTHSLHCLVSVWLDDVCRRYSIFRNVSWICYLCCFCGHFSW